MGTQPCQDLVFSWAHPCRARVVHRALRHAHRAAKRRLAAHPRPPQHADLGPHRSGKTSPLSSPASTPSSASPSTEPSRPHPGPLHLAPQSAGQRRAEEPRQPALRDPATRRRPRLSLPAPHQVRTGDTLPRRARMLRNPPHILVTTPESLYICSPPPAAAQTLRHVHTVIVDEIHALAHDKRGAHLAIRSERLDAIAHDRHNRIGLSATQRPRPSSPNSSQATSSEVPSVKLSDAGKPRSHDVLSLPMRNRIFFCL